MQTGFQDLDSLIGGFSPGDLVLLGGKTGTGKSTFTLNTALYAAQHGEAVAIFSFETTCERVMQRLTSTLTSVPLSAILNGSVSKRHWPELFLSARNAIWSRLYIVGSANLTVREMRDRLRQISRDRARAGKNPLSLIVVDPLQMMLPGTSVPEEQRRRRLGAIIILLKRMARDLRVPVLLVGQLDRQVNDQYGKPPVLSDLEVSEVAESYADKILFLHRDVYSTPRSDGNDTAEVIVAKQRLGPTGRIALNWQEDCGKFHSQRNGPASTNL